MTICEDADHVEMADVGWAGDGCGIAAYVVRLSFAKPERGIRGCIRK